LKDADKANSSTFPRDNSGKKPPKADSSPPSPLYSLETEDSQLEEEVRTMKTLAQRRRELLGAIYLLKREVDNRREPGLALLPARAGSRDDKGRGQKGYCHR